MNRPHPDAGGAETYAIGVDIGGTFTDCALVGDLSGEVTTAKVLTTPAHPSVGFFSVLDQVAERLSLTTGQMLARTTRVVHGTTRGTNALVSRHGAKVGLLTTMGHADVIRIMRGGGRTRGISPESVLHAPSTGKPEPFVPPWMVVEVAERIESGGGVVTPIDRQSVVDGVNRLIDSGAEAIAICFLWSVRNREHERLARQWVQEAAPHLFVTCSHEVVRSVGEFARFMATIMNAYIGPLMAHYVLEIETGMAQRGYLGRVLFAQCAGGAITSDVVRRTPIQTLQSGPVGGILASAIEGGAIGSPNIITADMGGTTLDVGIVSEGVPLDRRQTTFERFDIALPMVDVESIGAGGGSIAWIDDLGRLQVGPRSAGSRPGPACFGKGGTEPTVTDADVVLGFIDPEKFAHGTVRLDVDAAKAAIERVAGPLGMSVLEAAAGINRIVDSRMGDLVRRMSVMRGYDPRNFVCYAYGGAGPLHAGAIAREANVGRVIVPRLNVASVWSAFGASCGDIVRVFTTPRRVPLPANGDDLVAAFRELKAQAEAEFRQDGLDAARMESYPSLRMKYCVQVHDILVRTNWRTLESEFGEDLSALFFAEYERQFGEGSGLCGNAIEITAFELRAVWPTRKPAPTVHSLSSAPPEFGERPVYWDECKRLVATPVLKLGPQLPAGRFKGPLLIDLPDTVIVVRPDQQAEFDTHGCVSLIIDSAAPRPVGS
jgi:N-methylhydantoinase A